MPEITQELADNKTRVEVAWELTYNRRDGGEFTTTCWCPGTITRISDEGTKEGRRNLGLGWIYVEYDDNETGWLLATRPSFFNARKPGAWRFMGNADADDDEEDEEVDEEELVDADDEEDGQMDDDDWGDL